MFRIFTTGSIVRVINALKTKLDDITAHEMARAADLRARADRAEKEGIVAHRIATNLNDLLA